MSARTPSVRSRTRALGLAVTLVAGLGVGVAGSPAALAQDAGGTPLAVGQTASSPNMSLIANIPKNGAFAPETAFNSDLAFAGRYAYAGNYNGFTVYDLKRPRKPQQVVQVVCAGSQNDITVYQDLLIVSVDQRLQGPSCGSLPADAAQSMAGNYWEGVRIFDISDPTNPQYVTAVETDCGSHTNTLVPNPDGGSVYVYASSYNPDAALPKCQPPHDKISVIEVPLDDPAAASVVSEPVLFPGGGNPGVVAVPATPTTPAVNETRATSGCHDITAYPEKGIAAGACMGEGVIMDITDPVAPVVTETVLDNENFAFWHSATFNNEADQVVFTDELGGGGAATCNPEIGPNRGADAIYSLTAGQLDKKGSYKISRTQTSTENCVAHNGSLIPVQNGRDIMVQAWYQGGVSVFDFTNPKRPTEIAWFDRGPLSADKPIIGGSWSAYYYKGYIYSNDIQKGLDVFEVRDRRLDSALSFVGELNPQSQTSF